MRRLTLLDWIGATIITGISSIVLGVFLSEGLGAPEEFGVMVGFGSFFAAVVAARVWVLRQPEHPKRLDGRAGLTTGEAALTRVEELELRIAELEAMHERLAEVEDRLDFSERLLASGGQRQPQERPHA